MNRSHMTVEQIKHLIKNNPFTRRHYTTSLFLDTLIAHMFTYTHDDLMAGGLNFGGEDALPLSKIFEAVPPFQRDNDKWTEEMQVSFIENLLMGYSTDLMLFEIGDTTMTQCKILDGLQRITAIYRFLSEEIKAFGKTASELREAKILYPRTGRITLRIYTFDTELEAVDFYISINENITHSKEDIERAISHALMLQQAEAHEDDLMLQEEQQEQTNRYLKNKLVEFLMDYSPNMQVEEELPATIANYAKWAWDNSKGRCFIPVLDFYEYSANVELWMQKAPQATDHIEFYKQFSGFEDQIQRCLMVHCTEDNLHKQAYINPISKRICFVQDGDDLFKLLNIDMADFADYVVSNRITSDYWYDSLFLGDYIGMDDGYEID